MNPYNLEPQEIARRASSIRRRVLHMNNKAGQGHTGADLSETDMLAALYLRILDIAPGRETDPQRDRFILSKGHGAGGYYCALAEAGYIDESLLETYLGFDSALPGHPVRGKLPAVELNTGALGHGMPVAVGLALAAKRTGRSYRVFVLAGDGELQEGSNWEAAMSAAHFGLDNLTVIVDRNGLQLAGRTEDLMGVEPLDRKWEAFGWDVHTTAGNDVGAFVETIERIDTTNGRPHAVLARTRKGKGVSFIEDKPEWHHKVPSDDELTLAIEELT
ncbi:MAG: transketolase [Chitinivibrionales bacterium]|nr:transketolase [Chitinivibrionales bacterium]